MNEAILKKKRRVSLTLSLSILRKGHVRLAVQASKTALLTLWDFYEQELIDSRSLGK